MNHGLQSWYCFGLPLCTSTSVMLCLTNLLPIHVDAVARCRGVVRWQPVLGVLVVEGPRRDDDEEGEGGAGEANVECELDVLLREANEESNNLG